MPSFFEGLRRILTGQDVFKPGEDADGVTYKNKQDDLDSDAPVIDPGQQQSSSQYTGTATTTRTEGPAVIPQCVVEHVESRVSGPYLDVSVTIKNMSPVQVMLDKILLLGKTHELDYALAPGSSREFVSVYNGPLLTNRNYTHSEVQYRNEQDGEYYSAIHNAEFEQQPDNTYTINRIRFLPPVKHLT